MRELPSAYAELPREQRAPSVVSLHWFDVQRLLQLSRTRRKVDIDLNSLYSGAMPTARSSDAIAADAAETGPLELESPLPGTESDADTDASASSSTAGDTGVSLALGSESDPSRLPVQISHLVAQVLAQGSELHRFLRDLQPPPQLLTDEPPDVTSRSPLRRSTTSSRSTAAPPLDDADRQRHPAAPQPLLVTAPNIRPSD